MGQKKYTQDMSAVLDQLVAVGCVNLEQERNVYNTSQFLPRFSLTLFEFLEG